MGGLKALRQSTAYCASKAADIHMVAQLARELAGRTPQVTIFSVAPGSIENTAMIEQCTNGMVQTRGMSREQAEKYNVQSPHGRMLRHDEVCNVVEYAAFKAPDFMSGENFCISGST